MMPITPNVHHETNRCLWSHTKKKSPKSSATSKATSTGSTKVYTGAAKGISQLPVARVKRIIKEDKDEIFLEGFTAKAFNLAKLEKRKTVLYKDLDTAVTQYNPLEFLCCSKNSTVERRTRESQLVAISYPTATLALMELYPDWSMINRMPCSRLTPDSMAWLRLWSCPELWRLSESIVDILEHAARLKPSNRFTGASYRHEGMTAVSLLTPFTKYSLKGSDPHEDLNTTIASTDEGQW
ncbi:MAG: hypothetical protein J3Q66DRAFT_402351 [Benniella sp.]|nr:MAG: hypothetical protein J3Q66DRAFT_402351 [Benniella sp.]